ncbi:complement component C9 isoform X2 [Mobula hypostoma]|uniref:complement component C9 isoform X2 n=1 Tax=Mobula hypostoma TaxID=723540 RepID=UPI002FC2CE3A
MVRKWIWATLVVHLLLLLSIAARTHTDTGCHRAHEASCPWFLFRPPLEGTHLRTRRAVTAPGKISCELSPWGPWTPCQPCRGIKYRSRSIIQFGQFGGRTCTDILSEERPCPVTGNCEEEPVNCGTNVQCQDGHCINRRLKCNDDDDCGDFSDEDDCEDTRSPCRRQVEPLEMAHIAGSGANILGMEPLRNPFNNNLYNGICNTVYDGIERVRVRIPWNINAFRYQTYARQQFTTEMYESSSEVVKKFFKEITSKFNAGFSLKINTKVNFSAGLHISANFSKSFEKLLTHKEFQNNDYFLVKGQMELAQFTMRSQRYKLEPDFVFELKGLPTEYDKGAYFKILEDYGTHYTSSGALGGQYQLVYVLDKSQMARKEITTDMLKMCLGFDAHFNLQKDVTKKQNRESDGFSSNINAETCAVVRKEITTIGQELSLIKDVVSFVYGGDVSFLAKFNAMLSEGKKVIDASLFVDWAGSLKNSPVLVKQKLLPIYSLVPLTLRNTVAIRHNLERAINDYEAEFSVCKCQPCRNGGTVALLNGQCLCLCPHAYRGDACHIPKGQRSRTGEAPGGHGKGRPNTRMVPGAAGHRGQPALTVSGHGHGSVWAGRERELHVRARA